MIARRRYHHQHGESPSYVTRSVLLTLESTSLLDTLLLAIRLTLASRTWALVFGSRIVKTKKCSPESSSRKPFETPSQLTPERIHPTLRSILPYVLILRQSHSYTNNIDVGGLL